MSPVAALRRLLIGPDAERGRRWQRLLAETCGADARRRRAFEEAFRAQRGDGRVLLGRGRGVDGRHGWYGLPWEEAINLRAWITGTSGGGKTFAALAILLQLLRRRHVLWIFDCKGELSDLITGTLLPALASRPEGRWLIGRVHLIDLFGKVPPALRITDREVGVPREVQAQTLSATLQELLNADHGLRMERVFLMAGTLAIELREPLTTIARWLHEPALFAQAASRSADPVLRDYAANVFPKEPRASLHALSSRLDLALFLPQLRAAFEAPSCVSFAELCQEGVFVFRVGGAPAGSEGVEAAIGSLLLGRATRAVMNRQVDAGTLPLLMLIDEGQRAIRPRDLDHLERVISQARFKRSSFVFCNQQVSQLDPALAQLLRTNTSSELTFRASPEDAERLARHLPMPVEGTREGDGRRALASVITHLQRREFIFWAKEQGLAGRLCSPRIDLSALEREAASLPSSLRDELFAGTASIEPPDVANRPVVHELFPLWDAADPDDPLRHLG